MNQALYAHMNNKRKMKKKKKKRRTERSLNLVLASAAHILKLEQCRED
jgi:hypothetical protein